MKKVFSLLACIILMHVAFAQDYTIITGKITNPNSRYVDFSFRNILTDDMETYSDTLNEQDEFSVSFALPNPAMITLNDSKEYTTLFLEPGDNVHLILNTEKFDETIYYTGKGSTNCNYMAKSFLLFDDPDNPNYKGTAESYFDRQPNEILFFMDSLRDARLNFFNIFTQDNKLSPVFEKTAKELIYFGHANAALQYALGYPDFETLPGDIKKKFTSYSDSVSLKKQNPVYTEAFNMFTTSYVPYMFRKRYQVDSMKEEDVYNKYFFFINEMLSEPYASKYQGSLLMSILENGMDPKFQPLFDHYFSNCSIPVFVEKIKEMYEAEQSVMPGKQAPAFELKDMRGKMVKLSDFKGKIVYIDFWASWCGPCVEEIPFMESLKKKFKKNKNIVFLSISLDENAEEWKAAIKDNKMQGIQLINDLTNDVSMPYRIRFIPKFIIIDSNGNILKNPALQPSSDKIMDELNEIILKNK